jgi:hypothetical protein
MGDRPPEHFAGKAAFIVHRTSIGISDDQAKVDWQFALDSRPDVVEAWDNAARAAYQAYKKAIEDEN